MWLGLWATVASAHVPVVFIAGPSDDWCNLVNEEIYPGDVVLLEGGRYASGCELIGRTTDLDDQNTVVQPLEASDPPVFEVGAEDDFGVRITGTSVLFWGARFEGVSAGSVGLDLDGTELIARYNQLQGVDGTAIRVASAGVIVQDNTIATGSGTAIEVVCAACDPQIQGNLIQQLGRGIVATGARVEDNVFEGPHDPAIQVDGGYAVRNLMRGAVVGVDARGVDVTVTDNITLEADVPVELQAGTTGHVSGNTWMGGAVVDQGSATWSLNAVAEAHGDDVVCDASCFVDLAAGNVYPRADGPLVGAGDPTSDLDFCQRERQRNTAGALDYWGDRRDVGAFPEDTLKGDFLCVIPGEEPEPLDTGEGPVGDASTSCGCAAPATGALLPALLLLLGLRRRRG